MLIRFLSLLLRLLLTGAAFSQNLEGLELAEKQAVLVTDRGEIVLELFPGKAPQHVEVFLKRIRQQDYVGTAFHRAIAFGIIQGGDPLTRDPANRERYGSGGLFEMANEFNDVSHLRGTLSAVLVPGNPDSAGSQFFICVTDQTQLDGQYTAFGRVVQGMKVVEEISALPTDQQQRINARIEILRTYERDRPPPAKVPFSTETPSELARHHVIVETNLGNIELAFFPEQAPEHVRQFLRFAQLGLYDGTTFHRVVPGFVVQGGSLSTRQEPILEEYQDFLKYLPAEFNEHKHVRGVLSMARGDEADSAFDSFFIVLEPQPSLDGQYTVFGHVVKGIDTVDGVSQVPVQGETPIMPVRIERMRVVETEDQSEEGGSG